MPQLDATTYFTQFVWLCITYTTFYLVLTKTILPKIAKILYVRQNKATQAEENQSPETAQIQNNASQHMLQACTQAKQALESTVTQSQQWGAQATQDIQKAQLSSLQTEYTKQMQTSTYTFALMANALKLTLPPSAHTMLVQATNEQKARVFQKAVIKSLFKK